MIVLYLILLIAGVCLFALSYVAQFRLAQVMKQRYPQHWKIIAEPDAGKASGWRTWVRMQHAFRSPAMPALADPVIDRWLRVWRYSPWLGWVFWLGALAMRLFLS